MSILSDAELEGFWQAAASPVPIVIVGGGRWGRTWSIAASRARGSGVGITIASRSDHNDTRRWVRDESGFPGLTVTASLSEAMQQSPAPELAIVASRPRDHFRDGKEALRFGLDLLVEKPISDVADRGKDLALVARRGGRLLTVGTEFALLPAFHQCARLLRQRPPGTTRSQLFWTDPRGDVRYGAEKRRHEETSILVDLLPHAYSIFRIFAGEARLQISDLTREAHTEQAKLRLHDEAGGQYELICDKQATARRRRLEIDVGGRSGVVDFGTENPQVLIDGVVCPNGHTLHMRSTLRLELGAVLLARAQSTSRGPLSEGIDALLDLQADLEKRELEIRGPGSV